MKEISPIVLLALALTGCTPGSGDAPAVVESASVSAETAPGQKAGSTAQSVENPAPTEDIKTSKAEAIAAGRPVAAWDIQCVAWKTPEANTGAQTWANKLGAEFLESRAADCPDQITFPYYFIEPFEPGADGELIVGVEQDMNRILHSIDDHYGNLQDVASGVLDAVMDANPEVTKVTAVLADGKSPPAATAAR